MSLRCSNEADIEQQRLCDFESGVGGKLPDPHGLSMPIYDRSVSMQRKLIALLGYFVCNVGLTIYNKAILGKFMYPWLLTSIHAASSFAGCTIMVWQGHFHTSKLTTHENLVLLGFSLLFTINIAVSNLSLAMVSIAFHQVIRSTTPLVTTAIYWAVYGRILSKATYLSLLPIVLGVSIATYGDITYTRSGFAMTFLGVILAALKAMATNRMLTGRLSLSPLEMLYRMSPLACLQSLAVAAWQGELKESVGFIMNTFRAVQGSAPDPSENVAVLPLAIILAGNGALAFMLNMSSLRSNRLAGALTMTVCANIKQCLTIALGSVLFGTPVTTTNLWGIAITLAGGAAYSFAELKNR